MLIKNKLISMISGVMVAGLMISCSAGSSSNTLNGYAYIIPGSNTVQQCQITNYVVNTASCKNMAGTFESPTAVAFDVSKTYAYVANGGNNTLSICDLNNDKSFDMCAEVQMTSFLSKPASLAVAGSSLYIANNNQTVTQCTTKDDGSLSDCHNIPLNVSLKSLTVRDSNTLYGLANSGAIYSYQLPDMTSESLVNRIESGSPTQINYSSTNNLLYVVAKNNLAFLGGGAYACNLGTDPALCNTAYQTAQALLPIPVVAPIYTIATNGMHAYFIDYALSNPLQINSIGTLINSCSIDNTGKFTDCNASVLSTDNLYDKGDVAFTYLGL